ncbi:MAG TPA: hypothetical protein DCE42_01935 [Myxococcales bacterium]|nr:hypothetical protein [Myxococcales bacterium]
MSEESTLNCSSEDVVVVTGMGVYSPIGNTLETFWDALAAGRDGFREVTQFDTSMFSTHIAGTVEGTWRSMPEMSSWKEEDDCVGYGLYAALQARQHARIVEGALPRHRQALVVGTSMGSHQTKDRARQIFDEDTEQSVQWFDEGRFGVETAHIARGLGVEGVCLTLSTACTSSAHAIGVGRMLLQMDVADVVYVVGVDPIAREAFAGFFTLGVMSPQPCAPFGAPEGMSMGEGAGAIVLERSTHATQRDVRCVTALRGIGLSCDGFHPTTPEPSGKGIARAIESALSDGGLSPEDIGYYNAHGTGTLANDAAEWKGVQRVFGPHAASLPVSSTKSYLGHTQGAAGILELIATLLALQHQVVLPTLHLQQPKNISPMTLSPRHSHVLTPMRMRSVIALRLVDSMRPLWSGKKTSRPHHTNKKTSRF